MSYTQRLVDRNRLGAGTARAATRTTRTATRTAAWWHINPLLFEPAFDRFLIEISRKIPAAKPPKNATGFWVISLRKGESSSKNIVCMSSRAVLVTGFMVAAPTGENNCGLSKCRLCLASGDGQSRGS